MTHRAGELLKHAGLASNTPSGKKVILDKVTIKVFKV
jgi:hypothetical protein